MMLRLCLDVTVGIGSIVPYFESKYISIDSVGQVA